MFSFPKRLLATAALMACATLSGCAYNAEAQDPVEQTASTAAYHGNAIGYFGYGQPATAEQIAGWDIDVRPDGMGLPPGSGSVEDGEWLYEAKCAECHGSFGEGVGRYPVLAGGRGTLRDDRPSKTVGSYWAYTSTLFDYIYRAMPFTQPESLSADETYALTAYVLYLNDLIEDDLILSADNLATITLPNATNFVADPRPDVANLRCFEGCKDPASVRVVAEVAALEAPAKTSTPAAASSVTTTHAGQQTYDQFCSICHKIGVGGAPIIGDAAAWSARLARGLDQLVHNAINGISSDTGVMPPKGGFTHLTDEQVANAVSYMVDESS